MSISEAFGDIPKYGSRNLVSNGGNSPRVGTLSLSFNSIVKVIKLQYFCSTRKMASYQFFIDGTDAPATSNQTFQHKNPANQKEIVHTIAWGNRDDAKKVPTANSH